MPLTSLQSECLRLLAANRDPENYVVGSAFFTRSGSRISGDIDIFHDREMRVGQAADLDAKVLEAAEVLVAWQRRGATFYQTLVSRTGETTRLEWVVDSEFRFFLCRKTPILVMCCTRLIWPLTKSWLRQDAGSRETLSMR